MSNKMDRRSFLGKSAKIGVGLVGGSVLLSACASGDKSGKMTPLRQPGEYYVPELPDKAIDGKELKVGVIGCGGRGSGAVEDLLNAADGIKVTALGDVFADRLTGLRENLKTKWNQEVPEDHCFTGFDAYKQVIDSGVDMVIVATPPVFRPTHFQYATEKGVHSFLEKPIAVDAKGYRLIMATAKQAEAKGLSVVTGTQRHHQRPYVESFKKIQEGMIGLIKAVRDFDVTQKTSFSSFAELCVSRQMYSAIEASNRKKHLPLNSYVSLYEDSEEVGEGRSLPLIDTIESSKENDPEVLYFGKEYTEAFAEQLKELLSPLENHVLYLHLMGTDYRTIAELLGKSPKSVDNALQRIKTKAQKILP